MLVTIGAFRHPSGAQLPNHTTPLSSAEVPAGYPKNRQKKKIEIARGSLSPFHHAPLAFLFRFPSYDTKGSLSNDDALLYISKPSLHDYNVKVPNFTFCRGREHKATTFFFFS